MKVAKKLKLQVGVGLAIGFGALVTAAPKAQANPPCPNQNCNSDCPCPLVAGCVQSFVREWTSSYYACVNCDGTCPGQSHKVHVVEWKCKCPDDSAIGGYVSWSCETKQPVGNSAGDC